MIITNEHIGKKVYYLDDLGHGYIAQIIDIKKDWNDLNGCVFIRYTPYHKPITIGLVNTDRLFPYPNTEFEQLYMKG